MKLWAGMATGSTAGMILGAVWQLRDGKRRAITSGRFVVIGGIAWSLFSGMALMAVAPDLYAQERQRTQIRSLVAGDISAISVQLDSRQPVIIDDVEAIASFVDHAKRAELFYPSHEGSTLEFEMTIHRSDGTSLQYGGRVPVRHQGDFSIDFRGYFAHTEIIFPDGKRWLDAVID